MDKSEDTFKAINVERRGQADWVTLNRPDALNALNLDAIRELNSYFSNLCNHPETRVVVLKGSGKAFCVGLDLKMEKAKRNPIAVYDFQKNFSNVVRTMRRCPQPIIALVHGPACGAGFSLTLASDIRLAGESAKMNAAFVRVGYTGGDMGSSYFLPRLVGTSIASELLMTGRFIHAERALRVNLVSEVVPDSQLEEAGESYVKDMLLASPFGLRMTKDGLNFSVDAPSFDAAMAMEDRQQTLCGLSHDAMEARTAFLEKRAPEYKDE